MQSKAATVAEYITQMPEKHRQAIQALRAVIRKNLDPDIEEGMYYGMIGYAIPHRVFPAGYHCDPSKPLVVGGLASQKNAMSLYSMHLYMNPPELAWFTKAWKDAGKKLDMGKSCVRFKALDDVPLAVVGEMFERLTAKDFIARYEAALGSRGATKPTATKKAPAKPVKKTPARKTARKPAKKAARAASR